MSNHQDISSEQISLINFTSSETHRIPRHLFTAKLSFKQQRFLDLDIFRHQIEESRAGLHHQPYTNNKHSVFVYKTIFFGLAALFAILGITTMAVPLTIVTGFFNYYTAIKGLIVSLCALFSLASFTMAATLHTEKEAILHCVRKARAHLATIYARKRLRMGIKRFFAMLSPHRREAQSLKNMFHETYDKINEKRDNAMHFVHRIASAKTLDPDSKEALLNQAIEELDDTLMLLVHSFRHATPTPK